LKKLDSKGKLLPVMEEFYSLQGEGFNSGKAAYFIRIGGCDVGCSWCDVKESWDASIHPIVEVDRVIERVIDIDAKSVVITGGEPAMYNLIYLTQRLKENNIETFLETSGAYQIYGLWDWICLSPKKNILPLKENLLIANELKVIIKNEDDFGIAENNSQFINNKCLLYLQPEWSQRNIIIQKIVDYILKNPKWVLSLQSHKYIGIP